MSSINVAAPMGWPFHYFQQQRSASSGSNAGSCDHERFTCAACSKRISETANMYRGLDMSFCSSTCRHDHVLKSLSAPHSSLGERSLISDMAD